MDLRIGSGPGGEADVERRDPTLGEYPPARSTRHGGDGIFPLPRPEDVTGTKQLRGYAALQINMAQQQTLEHEEAWSTLDFTGPLGLLPRAFGNPHDRSSGLDRCGP
ncbi:MAG TPA: hypothetical protein VHU24_00085 [Solirubrobacterales bacterium]|nr:hypothetical protein [Solirubrobacterales bacterium]